MEIVWRDPSELRNNPRNIEIYGDIPDQEFVAKVKQHGICTPLKVLPDGTLLGGHRRRQAAIMCGITDVPVIILEGLSEAQQLRELALDNEARLETVEQRVKRAALIEEAAAIEARERSQANLRKGTDSPSGKHFSHSGKHEEKGQNSSPVRAADTAAKAAKMSRPTYQKAKAVLAEVEQLKADGKTAEADRVRDALEKSPAAAKRELARIAEAAQPPVEGCIVRDDTGRDVPLQFRDAYALAPQLEAVAKSVSSIKAQITRIETAAGAAWFDSGEAKRILGKIANRAKDACYWTHCLRCDASGCGWCGNRGWLPVFRSRNLCDEDKAKLEGGK